MEQVTAEPKIKFDVCCVKCGYKWKTGTPLLYISCPNCRHTNKTQDARDKFAESAPVMVKRTNPFTPPEQEEPGEDNSELKRMNRIAAGEE